MLFSDQKREDQAEGFAWGQKGQPKEIHRLDGSPSSFFLDPLVVRIFSVTTDGWMVWLCFLEGALFGVGLKGNQRNIEAHFIGWLVLFGSPKKWHHVLVSIQSHLLHGFVQALD